MVKTNPLKLRLPPLRRPLVDRPRLMKLLREALSQEQSLSLVCAPAGYGKTTLLRSWLQESAYPVVWASLDEDDAHPQVFLSTLIASLQALAAGMGEKLLRELGGIRSPNWLGGMDALLEELSLLDTPIVLALDDVHRASSPDVDKLLAQLVKNQPPLLHVVLATRIVPDLPLAGLRVRNRLFEIGPQDLEFSEAEAGTFFDAVMGMKLPPRVVARLEERTEGWAAALQLAALSLKGGRDPHALFRSFSGTRSSVADFLTEEVLATLPTPLQGLLLRAALVEPYCAGLWDAIGIGNGQGAELLKDLVQRNLFIVPLDQDGLWFRFHHLFAELLRHRAVGECTSEEISKIRIAASNWYESQGMIEQAFQQAMAAEDFARAADLAEASWEAMEKELKTSTWLRWVMEIPEADRRGRAALLTQMGWSYMDASLPEESEACLRAAEAAIGRPAAEPKGDRAATDPALPGRIATVRAYNALASGQEDLAESLTLSSLERIPPDEVILRAQAASLHFGIQWSRGNFSQAHEALGDFSRTFREAGNPVFDLLGSSGQAEVLRTQGKLRASEDGFRRVLSEAEARGLDAFSSFAYLGLGMIALERGDAASAHFEKAFVLAESDSLIDWAFRKSLAQAALCDSLGDLHQALHYLEQARRMYVRTPIPVLKPIDALRAQLLWNHGRVWDARYWAESLSLPWDRVPAYKDLFSWLLRFRILCDPQGSDGDKDGLVAGESVLRAIIAEARERERLASLVEAGLSLASFRSSLGDMAGAADALEEPLALANREGLVRTLSYGPGSITRLLSEAGMTKKILRPLPDYAQEARGASMRNLLEPLSRREREVLNLIAKGLSNEEIGERLFVSLSTVKGHNLRIFEKLQAKNRTEAVLKAREAGILEDQS